MATFNGSNRGDLIFGTNGNDNIFGNNGNDILRGKAGSDTIFGGLGNDSILGQNGVDFLYGDDGNDSIAGGNGEDYLYGNEGNDFLNGGNHTDTLVGGTGDDTYVFDVSAPDTITELLGEGEDTIQVFNGSFSLISGLYDHIENATLMDNVGDTLNGNDRDNKLVGNDIGNTIRGYSGNDEIQGNGGDDKLAGGIYINGSSNENGTGYDILDGGDGNDEIFGGDDDDTLIGGAGNDVLDGGQDDDILIGGAGRDVMTGHFGNDTYRYQAVSDSGTTNSSRDIIEDFEVGHDLIGLSQVASNLNFIGTNNFSGTQSEVRVTPIFISGILTGNRVQVNLNGTSIAADMEIDVLNVDGAVFLANTDFVGVS